MPLMSRNFVFVLILIQLVVSLASFISLMKHNFKSIAKNGELQNKILSAQLQLKEQELIYLKKQIHPHFLFNTLNTIYGLALKQSKDTPKVILKLSNLLDYILYQVGESKVSLKEELGHIEEYIELEKIRFQESLKVNYKAAGNTNNLFIAPMLLMPFVENAFKHGSIRNGFLVINIDSRMNGSNLVFTIKNSAIKKNNSANNGIGLENIKKRLIILYKDNHDLKIEQDETCYSLILKISI
jgi:sensor histidine kinase YesM